MAGSRGLITKAERLAAHIRQRFDRACSIGNEDRLIGGRTALDPDCKRLDLRGPGACQHIGERPEVSHLDAAKAHRFDHRGVIGGDDDLDVLFQLLLQIKLERLRVLDQGRGVFIRQQGYAQGGRILGGLGMGKRRSKADHDRPG